MLQGVEKRVSKDSEVPLNKKKEVPQKIREPTISYVWRRFQNSFFLALGDTLALAVSLLLAGVLRFWLAGSVIVEPSIWIGLLFPTWWICAFLEDLLPGWGYGPAEELRRITRLLCIVYGGLAITPFVFDQGQAVSHLMLGLAFVVSLWSVPSTRMWMRRLLDALGWWGIPVAVYGAGKLARQTVRLLREERGLGYDPIVVYDDDPESWGKTVDEIQVLGSAELVMPHAPVAILVMPDAGPERIRRILEGPLDHYRSTLIIPASFEVPLAWAYPRELGGMLGLEVKRNLSSPHSQMLKRAFDLLLVGTTAPLWGPLCALVAVFIWWEDGASPLFFQERVGKDGETIQVVKFRTMVPNAESVLQQKLQEDEDLRREWENSHKLRSDPRITRIGTVLRRLSLDELPQLWNVLRGEMSLVGPRPLPAYHHKRLTERARDLRERVRPGITGLWQIAGRSDAGTDGLDTYDPYYVRQWSLWLDAVILVRTVRAVVRGKGAY